MAENEKEGISSLNEKVLGDEKHAESPQYAASNDLGAAFGISEKSLLRKLDRTLLPAVTLLYLLSFLDRSNGNHHFLC